MKKSILKISLIALFAFIFNGVFAQSFTTNWSFTTDSLSASTGNVSSAGAYLNPQLFTTYRQYTVGGLRGKGTSGKSSTLNCGPLYNTAGATSPITPYMEMTMTPNAGNNASVDAFSFTVTGLDSITSANMKICAGYSTDGGVTFTGFGVSKNGTAITPNPDTVGTPVAIGDVITFSAPALSVASGNSLKIRIIYWKNAGGTTTANNILISSINLTGSTSSAGPTIAAPSPASLNGFSYAVGTGPSSSQSFNVSGGGLTSAIIVTASTNYEVSLSSAGTYSNSVSVAQSGGVVSSTPIYVRLKALTSGVYNESIDISSIGASSRAVTVKGYVTGTTAPTFTEPTPTQLNGFAYGVGNGPSNVKSFTFSGQDLIDTVKISIATTTYEISLSPSSGFVSNTTGPLKIVPVGGVVAPTMVYARLKAGLTASATSYLLKKVTIASTGATSVIDTLNGMVFNPSITVAPTALSGFNYSAGSGPSASQSFDVSASASVPVGIQAPSSYQISLTSGSGYTDSLTLNPINDSTVALTTIYVRLKAGLSAGNYLDSAIVSSNGAVSRSVVLSGDVTVSTTPTISMPLPMSLSGFTYVAGAGPSLSQSFTISGSNLTANLSLTAPTGFGLSLTSGGTFTSSVSVPQSGGVVASTTVYVTLLSGLSANTYSGNIAISSTGATAQSVAVNGVVTAPATTPTLTIPTPTRLTGFTYGVGNGPSRVQSFSFSGHDLTDTVRISITTANFEISLDPVSGFVTSTTGPLKIVPVAGVVAPTMVYARLKAGLNASATNYQSKKVTIASTGATSVIDTLYGTVFNPSITAAPSSLSGFIYTLGVGPSATQSFDVNASASVPVGIKAPASYEISLTSGSGYTDTLTLNPVNDSTVALTTIYVRLKAGLASGTYNDSAVVTSNAAVSKSVLLNGLVTTATATPTISMPMPMSLSGFTYVAGAGPSAAQSFTVGGSNLTAGIVITAPTGYGLSFTSGGTYTSSITLPQTAGTVASTTVYVTLLSGLSANTYSGNISITSAGAVSENVTVTGTVTSSGGSGNSFTATWPFLTDTLPVLSASSNMSASGAVIDPTLFTRLRAYGVTGLRGQGTSGKTASPSCSILYNSVGATTPITPFMQMTLTPDAGFDASLNAFSFTITGDSISSANMLVCAGYSVDGGLTFTGFAISKNGTAITPNPDTLGTSVATGDILTFSAPALTISAGNSLKIRIIYWKNASGTTSGNRIILSAINITGTTSASGPVVAMPSPMSLSGFTYIFGAGPSAAQSFTVGGVNLTAGVVATAPTGYGLSLSPTGPFTSTVTLPQTGGTVASTPVYVALSSGLAIGVYNGNVTITTSGGNTQNLALAGTVTALLSPTLTIPTPTRLSGFTYGVGNGPSRVQSFSFSGHDLIDTVKISITTANFEISLDPVTGFVTNTTGPLKIVPVNGVVPTTLVYARLKAGLNASATAYLQKKVTIASTGATSVIDTLYGTVFTPSINANPLSLTGFDYVVGAGPSATQSFSVNASASVPVGVKAPVNYEISLTSGSGYTDSLTLSPINDSTVALTSIYVRLKAGLPVGTYSDSSRATSNGAVTKAISLTGNVTAPPCSSLFVSISNKSSVYNTSNNSYDVNFTLTGTNAAVVTYQINGGTQQDVTLDVNNGTALISLSGVNTSQTLTLVKVTTGICTKDSLNLSSTVDINAPNAFSDGVTVFPNPYHQTEVLNVHFENMNIGKYIVRVTNSIGQTIYNEQKVVDTRNYLMRLTDLTKSLESGIYHLEIISTFDNQKIVKPIFIN